MERKVLVTLSNAHQPTVEFIGGYVKKRELELILKVIKREHRQALRNFRKQRIIEEYEAKKELSNGNQRQDGQKGDSGSGGRRSATKKAVGA